MKPNTQTLWQSLCNAGALSLLSLAAVATAGCDLGELQPPTFDEFKAQTFREPGESGMYIVDGDVPIADDVALRAFYDSMFAPEPEGPRPHLAINTVGGQALRWAPGTAQNLSYCVSRTFAGNYETVIAAMERAAAAWESAANVSFVHVQSEDLGCNAYNGSVVFDVSPAYTGQYLARAFFPGDGRVQRNVMIDRSSFTLPASAPYDLDGVLRHELGHVLGFRHEHTRPESGTCFEDANWRPLTPYDRSSVMHYPQCNGNAQTDLSLTALDRQGAALVYPR